MKTCVLLFTTCLLFASFVVACAPAPTVAPSSTAFAIVRPSETATRAATVALPTASPIQAASPTATPTPGATPIANPSLTSTVTAIPTSSIRPEYRKPPDGRVTFQSDLAHLDDHNFPPSVIEREAGDFRTGDIPGFGPGMQAFSVGVAVKDKYLGDLRRRAYPVFYPGNFDGPHRVGMDIMIEKLSPNPVVMAHDKPFVSILSIYGQNPDDQYQSTALVTVNIEPRDDGTLQAVLYTPELNVDHVTRGFSVNGAPEFKIGYKYHYDVVVRADRTVLLFQTDLSLKPDDQNRVPKLVQIDVLGNGQKVAFRGGHGGVYTGTLDDIVVDNSNLVVEALSR